MAIVKTGTLYFWSWPPDTERWNKAGVYVLGRRDFPWEAVEYFKNRGGIWQDDGGAFTPWHEIKRVTIDWADEEISEELALQLRAEGRIDVVLGKTEKAA